MKTRREFLTITSSAAALGYAASLLPRSAQAASPREKLFQFRYSDITLTGGPLKSQFDRVHAAYVSLNEDNLLKELRTRAGLAAPGEFRGGWYDRDGFAPGHCLGQYISGLARFTDATGDAATRAKTKRLVEGFAATIAPDGYCYFNQKASTTFPAYIYDKYLIGLLDAYQFAGVSSALEVLDRVTTGALKYLPPRAIDRNLEALKQAPDDESYTLAENLFYAHDVTGNDDYLELAKKFLLSRTYFEPLARGENVLQGRHAYSHCNALSSAARAYQGDPKYFEAVKNAWDMNKPSSLRPEGGDRTKPSWNPIKGSLAKVSPRLVPILRRPAGPMRISSWRGTYCALRVKRGTEMAWSGYCTTPFWGRWTLTEKGASSTTPTTTLLPRSAILGINGRAARERCLKSWRTTSSARTSGVMTQST